MPPAESDPLKDLERHDTEPPEPDDDDDQDDDQDDDDGDDLDNDEGKDPDDLDDTLDERRDVVVSNAESQIGVPDTKPFYESALPGVGSHSWPKHWCGVFCLWALHMTGLARSWVWEFKPAEKK